VSISPVCAVIAILLNGVLIANDVLIERCSSRPQLSLQAVPYQYAVRVNPEMGEQPLAPPPWQRTPQRESRRRRDPLTQEAIVDAAIRVLDAEGLDGLSMRRVADELDTGAASLYWHVGSKDGLLDLILERVIGEQQVPAPDPERWQEQLKEVARTMRAMILRHRDIVRISIGRVPMGSNALEWSERVLAILRAGGVSDELAVLGHHLLISSVNGFTIDETGEGGERPPDAPPPEEMGRIVRNYIASLPAERFPNMVALADHYAIVDQDTRFELLLDLFVDGLARRAEREAA
jgi:TetR/AcrR family tetracycline transcriptional repressor